MKLFLCIVFSILSIFAKAQDDPSKYLYLDSLDNDTIALTKIKNILSDKNTDAKYMQELQVKQLYRLINVEKFDSAVILANKYILEIKDKKNKHLARFYSLKGSALYYLFNLDKARETLQQGIEIANENKDYLLQARMCNNLGGIFVEQKKYNEAEVLLKKSLYINKFILKEESILYFQSMRILATNYEFQKKYYLADSLFQTSINGFEKLHATNGAYQGALNFYAAFLSKQGQSQKAKELFDKALKVERKNVFTKDISALYYLIGHFYTEQKDYEKGCLYLDSSYHSQDVDFQEKNAKELAIAEKKFNTEILKRDIKIANQKKLNWIYAFSLLAAIGIATWLVNSINQKKKDARLKLEQQQITINSFIEGEEKEKTRLSRELHDGIGQELLALSMKLRKQGNNPEVVQTIDNIGKDIRGLSHQLMPMTLHMLGLIAAMEEICDSLLGTINIKYKIDVTGLQDRLAEKIEISLYRIFQELMHNIVKHSAATEVHIQLINTTSHINLIVEDNGIGFQQKDKPNGIGLNNLKSRVNMMNGQLRYESHEGEGATTIVRVPI